MFLVPHRAPRLDLLLPVGVILAMLLLAGCTTLTLGGVFAASRLAPLKADPAAVSAAVSVPAGVGLRTGDAHLAFGYTPDPAGPAPFVERFELAIVPMPDFDGADARDAVFGAGLAVDDHDRFRRAQARVHLLRASGDGGVGTLSIRVSSACYTGERPTGLPVATWLRTSAEGDWVRLTRRRDVLELDGSAAELRDSLEACGAD